LPLRQRTKGSPMTQPERSEKDFLVYSGNKVPRVLRLVWTVLILFCVFYLVAYAVPDLKAWLEKLK